MTPAEYEQLTANIAASIVKDALDLKGLECRWGNRNRLEGGSGYSHQIDVSLRGKGQLYLIECKRWRKPIGVSEILVLSGRGSDIAANNEAFETRATIVSTRHASSGAEKLAAHFGVNIEIVESETEFGLRVGRHIRHALHDRVGFSDSMTEFVRRNGESQ